MKRVIYSTRLDAFKDVCPYPEIYIAPKVNIPLLKKVVDCSLIAAEDIDKTATWLWLNEAVQDGTRVVYDRLSRYYKVDSDKARRLSRLAELAHVCMVDIVPFCEHRKFLYMTWRYISRAILGYAHYYAFSGDHGEEIDGRIVNSLDESLLCGKIASYVVACESRTPANREIVNVAFSAEEHAEYLEKRDAMFAKYKTPQPILTRLADLSHSFATRREVVAALLDKSTVVICNLSSYAKHYEGGGTYAKPPKQLQQCKRVVFAEPPIVMTYKRLDIESRLAAGTKVIDIIGDTKVDRFLCGRIDDEITGIDKFMERLRESIQTEKRS